jgi:hypothetical protein
MLTKDIISGFNILSLAGFAVTALTVGLNCTGKAGRALSIGLMGAGRFWSSWGYMRAAGRIKGFHKGLPTARPYRAQSFTAMSSAGTPRTAASASRAFAPCRTSARDQRVWPRGR